MRLSRKCLSNEIALGIGIAILYGDGTESTSKGIAATVNIFRKTVYGDTAIWTLPNQCTDQPGEFRIDGRQLFQFYCFGCQLKTIASQINGSYEIFIKIVFVPIAVFRFRG